MELFLKLTRRDVRIMVNFIAILFSSLYLFVNYMTRREMYLYNPNTEPLSRTLTILTYVWIAVTLLLVVLTIRDIYAYIKFDNKEEI